jgi:hypothetical protein
MRGQQNIRVDVKLITPPKIIPDVSKETYFVLRVNEFVLGEY